MNNKKEIEREELHKTIWKIANELRGSVDGWDFKQYVLGLLFYRFISENIENYVNENQRKAGIEDFKYRDISDEEALLGKTQILEADEVDENAYITQLSKVFVIDLLSLNNKINKYEVTSSQFFNSTKKDMFINKVVDNFYDYIEDNAYNDRKQLLPEVSEVVMDELKTTKYKMGEESVDAYEISANVSYVSDLGYDKKVDVILTKEDNKYSVVAYNPASDDKTDTKK